MTEFTEVKEAIRSIVKERFADAKSLSVKVERAEDFDGEGVLKIYVIFEPNSSAEGLDPSKMSGLPRHIISKLEELKFQMFPLVSYVSKKEAAKLNLEAA